MHIPSSNPTPLASSRLCIAALAAAVLAAACGGGGGNAGGGNGGGSPYAITADNAKIAARAGLAAVNAGQLSGTASGGLVGPLGADTTISQARNMRALAARVLTLNHPRALAVQTLQCGVSGSITLSFTDTNANGQLDRAGDAASLSANQCDGGTGVKLNGSFTLTLTAYTDAQHFGFNLVFMNFTATDLAANAQFGVNGNLAVAVVGAASTVRGDSFTVAATDHGFTHSFTAQNYNATVTDDGSQVTESLTGTFSGSDFSGRSVNISTPTTLVTLSGDSYPSQGSLLIQGSGGSALKVDALNATQARLSVDANGDGSYETVTTVNWSDIG